jgi:hypothetical protein
MTDKPDPCEEAWEELNIAVWRRKFTPKKWTHRDCFVEGWQAATERAARMMGAVEHNCDNFAKLVQEKGEMCCLFCETVAKIREG